MSDLALLADVGGTNVRFALADPSAGTPLLQDSIQPYSVADFPSLADVARHYLDASGAHVAQGVFAVAGRVEHGQARMTNHSWVVSHTELSAKLKLDALELVNDFVAQAMAVRLLRDEDLMAIGSRAPAAATADPRTCGVLGPGTGLGVAALIVRNGRALALATEGGHIGFAPGTDEEVAVLQRLAARFGHVSNERLVSGGGLVNLHRALAEISGAPWNPAMQPADVTAGADAGDALCLRTIDLFCAVFGSVAGDMALVLGAWDGVFLSGGLVPRLLDELKGKGFRARFEAKGRYAGTLAQVPTAAVVHPQPGLLGAAALACDIASERAR